jgi:MoaA/NifB/PqqE/SkfB family radical SAM enzyme
MVLYRGPLSSCNYGCTYCPFAKHTQSPEELQADRESLDRFVRWVCSEKQLDRRPLSVLFTPWGEALTRRWYQQAFVELSHNDRVAKVAAQTNLSCRLDWLDDCVTERVALWCTFHPGEVSLGRFAAKCAHLIEKNVRFSVGIVATHEHYEHAVALRAALPESTYVWANAYRREDNYYTKAQLQQWTQIDPLFALNLHSYASLGEPCHAGSDAITVDGDGVVRRCHFDPTILGNIADDERSLSAKLLPSACTMPTCRCHIGYVHLASLPLYDVFRGGILERIPHLWPQSKAPTMESIEATVAPRRHALKVVS